MRSPHGGIGGFIAMTFMGKFSPPSAREAIRRLDLQPSDTFVELGAGHGAGLREIAKLKRPPKRIVCVEISDDFRRDKIFGMNVVYFLDPLSEYLDEINRVLTPKGKLVWGCKFANLPRENAEFANVSRRAIVDAMGEAGFEVSTAKVSVDGGDPKKDYIELLGEKK